MADDRWIMDQDTLDQAKEEASAAIQAMQPYRELALTDEERLTLSEVEGHARQRISLIDGVMSAMGALQADGYPEAVDTSRLAPFQHMLEQAHAEAGKRLEEMAEHIVDAPHELSSTHDVAHEPYEQPHRDVDAQPAADDEHTTTTEREEN